MGKSWSGLLKFCECEALITEASHVDNWSGLMKFCGCETLSTEASDVDCDKIDVESSGSAASDVGGDKNDGGKNEMLQLICGGVDILPDVIPYAAEVKNLVATIRSLQRAIENQNDFRVLLKEIVGKMDEGSILRSYFKFLATIDSNDVDYKLLVLDLENEVTKYFDEMKRVDILVKKSQRGPTFASANNLINCVKFINSVEVINSDRDDLKDIFKRLIDYLAAIHIIRAKIEATSVLKSKQDEIRQLRTAIAKILPNVSKLFAYEIDRHLKNFIPGSRARLITALDKFLDEPGGSKLFWLKADAGMGKSAFASMAVNIYSGVNRIAGYFFCRFNDVERSNGRNLIKSLAAQIAVNFPECCKAIKEAAEKINDDATLQGLMTKLVEEPLKKFAYARPSNMLLVIDALDEYLEGSIERAIMLELLKHMIEVLPSFVKVLLTCRPDEDIMKAFKPFKSRVIEIEVEVI